ncbi:hypothetical protein [uncultured Nostoc sp.]|uniref:hypothetical protein n=1 Tax=uncultured Nostoc sp. TaxID=340711 RepID=UPI0035CC3185
MEESLPITILISATVVAGIAAQVLAGYFHIPSIVLLLLFGILLGRDGFDFLNPSLLGIGFRPEYHFSSLITEPEHHKSIVSWMLCNPEAERLRLRSILF